MKVGKKILNFIFVLVIALSFTFIGVKSVVFKTIFNKEYVLEQMEIYPGSIRFNEFHHRRNQRILCRAI